MRNDRRYIQIRQMTGQNFSEGTHLTRISMCIQCTFLRICISSQEFVIPWIHRQRKAARRGTS